VVSDRVIVNPSDFLSPGQASVLRGAASFPKSCDGEEVIFTPTWPASVPCISSKCGLVSCSLQSQIENLKSKITLPMWRNGRRNGLKIRSGVIRVWVRIPSSAPSKMRVYEGNSLGIAIWSVCERSRTTTHKDTLDLSSIRQLTAPVHAVLAAAVCLACEFCLRALHARNADAHCFRRFSL
jgi:hypothetical protein